MKATFAVISLLAIGANSKSPDQRMSYGNIFKLDDDSLIINTPTYLDDLTDKGIPLPDDPSKNIYNLQNKTTKDVTFFTPEDFTDVETTSKQAEEKTLEASTQYE